MLFLETTTPLEELEVNGATAVDAEESEGSYSILIGSLFPFPVSLPIPKESRATRMMTRARKSLRNHSLRMGSPVLSKEMISGKLIGLNYYTTLWHIRNQQVYRKTAETLTHNT